jgi:hypothetical protein
MPAAVLAGEIIPAEDFAPGELDMCAGPADHVLQPDDGWARESPRHGVDVSTTVRHEVSLSCQH